VKGELAKVSWPEKTILMKTTVVIIFLMIILGIYVGFVDIIFSRLISLIIK
ncbi:MAG TPA: preprotein translocase subunit SecE, partial [bacterium]|nr:preprotein translocase subunit SecE [bacterium]